MVRNPAFRDEYYPTEGEPNDAAAGLLADAGKPLPFVDRIIWKVIEEDPAEVAFILAGPYRCFRNSKGQF